MTLPVRFQLLLNWFGPVDTYIVIAPRERCCALLDLTDWEVDQIVDLGYIVELPHVRFKKPRMPNVLLVTLLWRMMDAYETPIVTHFRKLFARQAPIPRPLSVSISPFHPSQPPR